MQVPFFCKENPGDCGCAPVCLRMALAYFKIHREMEEIYKLVDSLGTKHYTFPWGMCNGTASVGLHATFISKNPNDLLEESYDDKEN